MPELDLTRGRSESGTSRPNPTQTAENLRRKAENELHKRLVELFGRISAAFASREDEELAAVFEEDKEVMSNGLLSLTDNVKPLRGPLVFGLNLVEPILAFGRLVAILVRRWRDRVAYEEEPQPGG